MATARIDSTKAPTTPRTIPHTHHMSTTDATAVLTAWHCHEGEPGGLVIVDTPQGLKAHYTPNPGNIAGRMVLLRTDSRLDPITLRNPPELAQAVNAAMDNADEPTTGQPDAMKDPGAYSSPRVYVDHPTPERTYETSSLALELANVEPLYTMVRAKITKALAAADPDSDDLQQVKADAVLDFVTDVLELIDTTSPGLSLLVTLANAATARVDWSDVADQISEDL